MFFKTTIIDKFSWLIVLLLTIGLSSCWSPRCPRPTCRVRVEHRHNTSYYRPREAFSWVWSRKYKHVRTIDYAAAGPNSVEKVRIWDKLLKRARRKENKISRKQP